ncbi:class III signal peptide-containing protein [Methanofervidicoccus abyssi]|uniref:Class III signal peptide n=1 Tax=Methanofervidicoccus abyssi TaxID=2082189 RepID=A0A401HPG3_9EURY|nr:class III signal peptide-containing protein [Methanofervidicoccus abyssi]GBF36167.1 hypothetical protein MHHB_P0392 [Methanofervidicoccus abyssi]
MRGQISLEFSIIFLALLIVVIISTIIPSMYGYGRLVETSLASLGHGALSKLKTNIEMLSVLDPDSRIVVYIRSPPGVWEIDDHNITLRGDGFTISTRCDINLNSNVRYYNRTNLSVIEIHLEKVNDTTININWT